MYSMTQHNIDVSKAQTRGETLVEVRREDNHNATNSSVSAEEKLLAYICAVKRATGYITQIIDESGKGHCYIFLNHRVTKYAKFLR